MNITPTQFENLRVAGERAVVPDSETKAAIASSGLAEVFGSFDVCIDDRGRIFHVWLVTSTGYERFDDSIYEAIQRWRFRPYRLGEKTIPVCTSFTIVYRS